MKGRAYNVALPLSHKSPAVRYRKDGRVVNRLLLKVDVQRQMEVVLAP